MMNHKGDKCKYKDTTCIEGFCNNCEIFLDKVESRAEVDANKYKEEKCRIVVTLKN